MTKVPVALRSLSYEERLEAWGLTTLAERRSRGDLIQMYKVMNGLENINWSTGPKRVPPSQTRAATNNSLRLIRETFPSRSRNDFGHSVTLRHEFFTNRVVGSWNSLPNFVVSAPSLNSFKARIDNLPVTAAIAQ